MLTKFKSLRSKIFIGYLLVILILVIVAVWTINNMINLSDAINNIMVENYQSIKASESMIESLERQDSAILMILNGKIEEGNRTFKENERDFISWLTRAEDNITIEGEEEITGRIEEEYFNYLDYFDEIKTLQNEEQREFYYQQVMNSFYNIKEHIRELRAINQQTMVAAQEKADSRAGRAIISTSGIAIIAIIFAIGFGLYLSNLILKPIKKLENGIKKVADKNFEQEIEIHSNDEIGELAFEFNEMIKRLREFEKLNINKLVAERDKSEAIVNNINSPLLVTDDENRIVLLNHSAETLFNIKQDKGEETHFLELIKNEELFEIISENEDNDHDNMKNSTITITDDDEEQHFKVSINTVYNEKGKKKYTVTLLEDITKLKEIDEMKSEFVSTVSHEFRTPLTSMNMSLSMLLEEDVGKLNEEQRQLLEATGEDVERLNELVNDLLDLSRIEAGNIRMEFDKVNVGQLIKSTREPFIQQAEQKGIDLKYELAKDNIFAYADPSKISWVISNLIGNALRYTPEEGMIEIRAEQKGQYVYIHVQDTGVGIDKAYQDKIFDKFVRANNNEDAASGTGLGLAIAREIIEAHGGEIWVESEVDEGSTFSFNIPKYRSNI